MFSEMTRKIITTITATMVALSSFGLVPALAFAKENHGQEVKASVHAEHEDGNENGNEDGNKVNFGVGMGIGKLLSVNGLSTVSSSNLKVFQQQIKDARKTQKQTDKTAKTQLKTDLSAATTQDQKNAAVKTFLQNILSAFQTFASAKTAALTALINSIGVTTTNQAPIANAQSVSVNENNSVNITLTGSDPENSPLTFSVVSSPIHGVLTGTVPNLTYTPNTNFNGSDSFNFRVNDGSLNSAIVTVSITVNGVNQAPTANAQSVTTTKNVAKAITLTGSDPEAASLTFTVLTNPAHGTLSGTVPNLSYLPATDFTGSDSFTFKVNDGTLDSTTATVSIAVNP